VAALKQGKNEREGVTDAWARPSLKGFKQIKMELNMIQMISNMFKLHSIKTGPSRGQTF
jgi:hypothetical protein